MARAHNITLQMSRQMKKWKGPKEKLDDGSYSP